jgi:hypothetical protein
MFEIESHSEEDTEIFIRLIRWEEGNRFACNYQLVLELVSEGVFLVCEGRTNASS